MTFDLKKDWWFWLVLFLIFLIPFVGGALSFSAYMAKKKLKAEMKTIINEEPEPEKETEETKVIEPIDNELKEKTE